MMLGVSQPALSHVLSVNGQMNTNIGGRTHLDEDRWAYIWADDIYSGPRSEQDKLCVLVVIGVNERGQRQFIAIKDGVKESTQSCREVLLKLKNRGMNLPQLAIGDRVMGFWATMDEIFPHTRHQRC